MENAPKSRRKTLIQFAVLLLFLIGLRMSLKSYIVQGPVLEPQLLNGDRVLVEMITPRFGKIDAGDIVLCTLPGVPGANHLNRVVGVPGDVVEVYDHQVWINGTAIPNSFTEEPDREQAEVIPEGKYFMLESGAASKSDQDRQPRHGLVSQDDVRGRTIWRFWPLSR